MLSLEALTGVDPTDPRVRLAVDLAREDRSLLRRLKNLRHARGLTQNDVARQLGVSQPAIAAFERHDSDPKLSTVRRYAQVIGASVTHTVQPYWLSVPVAVQIQTSRAAAQPIADEAYASRPAAIRVIERVAA